MPPASAASLFDRLPGALPDEARLYLRPLGLASGPAADRLIECAAARRLAGGPLAFTALELILRWPGACHRATAPLAAVDSWADRAPPILRQRLAVLDDRLTANRLMPSAPRLMGIVNVTPDSFSDGGLTLAADDAVAHALALAQAGADIIDIGGESTRPGAAAVAPEVESARVAPVLARLAAMRPALGGALLSIDTRHAAVMRLALAAGVDIINDVSALTHDPDSLAVAAASRASIVLMHMAGVPATMNRAPAYDDVALDVFDHLEARITSCVAAGIAPERLIVDPGIGFGKRGAENLAILRSLALFHGLGRPLLLGLSRKGLGDDHHHRVAPRERLPASLAAAMHALNQGAQLLRVHEVAETRQAVELWRRLCQPGSG
jgi:dihydropteroate synthase